MTEPMSGSTGRRWLRRTIPVGVTALLAVGATAGPVLAATAPARSAGVATGASGPVTSLVAPTGDHRVGTVRLHLVDSTRVDVTSPDHGARELMA